MQLFPITQLIEKLEAYLRTKGEILKLEAMGHLARMFSYVIVFGVLGFVGSLLLLFLYITLAAYLNEVLSSVYLGYLILCGILLLKLVVISLLLRSGKLQKWIESLIIDTKDDE